MDGQADKVILVVDDEAELRELIVEHFRLLNYCVLEAGGGHEAFKIFQSRKIDIVITDFRMAQGNGLELIDKVRLQTGGNPFIVLITGYADQHIGDLRLQLNTALLDKPFRFSELQTLVEAALVRQAAETSDAIIV